MMNNIISPHYFWFERVTNFIVALSLFDYHLKVEYIFYWYLFDIY